jgi:hypothetical protein
MTVRIRTAAPAFSRRTERRRSCARTALRALLLLTALLLTGTRCAPAQLPARTISPSLQAEPWPASWIAAPEDAGTSFGVYHFRRSFELSASPSKFVVHVSADNRYRLYVNGTYVAAGPARGDLNNWHFESLDLAPHLKAGSNVIAAVVWNFAQHRPVAQHSFRTAFLVQGDTEQERIVDTGSAWKVHRNEGYAPIPVDGQALGGVYIVVGPGERVDGEAYPWGWQQASFDDRDWKDAAAVRAAVEQWGPNYGIVTGWRLTPRAIPMMEERPIRFQAVRRTIGVETGRGFVDGTEPLTIPPNSEAVLLLDQGHLTTAYPLLTVSGGRGSRVELTYAEALFDAEGRKGHRDEIAGKNIRGIRDEFLPDGERDRTFSPLWFRTYRYVQLEVTTGQDALTIDDLHGRFTAYPFEERAQFTGSDSTLSQIWDVGWRTARLCAAETYFDCPYYEQLQYAGDTRIQALISLYVAGDDRLMRQAISAFDVSRLASGLTQSRYPSYETQIIPPYSLFWIVMVHDFWMLRDDRAFVESQLTGIRGVIDWYERHLDETGLLGPTPWWNFVDWSFPRGVAPGADEGHSSIVALQFVYAVDRAAELSAALGREHEAVHYRRLADRTREAVYDLCWDAERGLLADTPEKASFSQHATAMGVLTGAVPQAEQAAAMQRLITDPSLIQTSYYYRFYLDEAVRAAGLASTYVDRLGPWHDMLDLGLTTFAEQADPTRSDAHAWSSSPNYHFLATVCGIRPAAPGFESVLIEPAPGSLTWIEGRMPHPSGTLLVRLEVREDRLIGRVDLPVGVAGVFRWNGTEVALDSGETSIDLSAR